MKYLVLSDSHMKIKNIKLIEDLFTSVDGVIHLGDNAKDMLAVKVPDHVDLISLVGNCDPLDFGQEEIVFEVLGKKVLMTHGHLYDVKFSLNALFYRGMELEVDAVLYGHTHVPHTENAQGMWLHNPGSLAFPRGGYPCTYSIMTIENSGISFETFDL